jgi:phosphatidylinositol alpha-1,6-mannosyltransferase
MLRFQTIWRVIRSFKPHLVLASGSHAIWVTAIILRFHKIPWVLVGHGTEFGAQKGIRARITRLTGNQAQMAICVSRYTQKALHTLRINQPPSLVIYNGADHTRFYRLPAHEVAAFRSAQAVEGQFVLLTVGSVTDRKGQEVVIRALPRIIREFPNVQYWMAGLPNKQSELETLAQGLGVGHHLRFWGRIHDEILLMLYNACDLFVMTSRQLSDGDFEGYGIAVIEAALCGKAAVVSDNSGLAEAVQHNYTGLLVPQNDPEQTAESILVLIKDHQKRAQFETQARKNAIEHQTWEQVGARYVKVFNQLLTKEN